MHCGAGQNSLGQNGLQHFSLNSRQMMVLPEPPRHADPKKILQGGGGISGGENFAGKISPLRKVAKISPCRNSIAFGKSTSQRIYSKQHTHKIGKNDMNMA